MSRSPKAPKPGPAVTSTKFRQPSPGSNEVWALNTCGKINSPIMMARNAFIRKEGSMTASTDNKNHAFIHTSIASPLFITALDILQKTFSALSHCISRLWNNWMEIEPHLIYMVDLCGQFSGVIHRIIAIYNLIYRIILAERRYLLSDHNVPILPINSPSLATQTQ